MSGTDVVSAKFNGSDLTKEQLYSTGSYQAKNLQGIDLIDHIRD